MHVFLIAAVSADGFIAPEATTNSLEWTSAEDTQFFRSRTKEAGVMVMGRTTFDTIGRALPGRKIYVMTRSGVPKQYAGLDPEAVAFVSLSPAELVAEVAASGATELAVCGGAQIYTQFVQAGVVDTLYLTYEPVVFGSGVALFSEAVQAQLELVQETQLSQQTRLVEYRVQKKAAQ